MRNTSRVVVPQATPSSWAGLDAVRAWSAVAVVVLHSCVPYASPKMPGLVWSVTDTTSTFATVVMWSIEIVIMPIFFVLAGFLAARSMSSRGVIETVKTRCARLGKPLVLAVVLLTPVELYIWLLGWLADGLITPNKLRSLKFVDNMDEHLWGLSHLWFLQYLVTYIVVLGVGWSRLNRVSSKALTRFGLPACLAASVATLTIYPEVVWGFQHAFMPVVSKWIYSGLSFAAGVLWWRIDPNLSRLQLFAGSFGGPSALVWAAAVCMGMWYLKAEPAEFSIRACLALLTAAAALGVTFAIIGVAMNRIVNLGPVTQYLAKASFLIYIFHHPVVGLAHISAKFAMPGVSPMLKVSLVATTGVLAGCGVQFLVDAKRRRASEDLAVAPATLPYVGRERMPDKRAA